MGLISIVRQFARTVVEGAYRTYVTHDPGYPDTNEAYVFGPSGEDSPPLPEDSVYLGDSPGAGRENALGYMDTRNEGVAEPGEKRMYARDPDGAIVATIWMQGDGTIFLSNGNGSIEMAPSGDVTINGVTIDTSGNISTDGDIDAGGDITATGEVTGGALPIALTTHTHNDSLGGPTTAPIP
jgi:hypothetical protein